MGAHYQDQGALQVATDACVAAGMRVLQLYQAGTEVEHVRGLLKMMAPAEGATIVDVGCGIGEVARLMLEDRPDLGFLLLNLSAHQLEMCPEDLTRVHADMHDMPLVDACADVVMVNYTLGYADLARFMAEATRVLRPGGIVFIYDLLRADDDPGTAVLMLEKFGYSVHGHDRLMRAAGAAGLQLATSIRVPASFQHLAPLLDETYWATLLSVKVYPVALRFQKAPYDK